MYLGNDAFCLKRISKVSQILGLSGQNTSTAACFFSNSHSSVSVALGVVFECIVAIHNNGNIDMEWHGRRKPCKIDFARVDLVSQRLLVIPPPSNFVDDGPCFAWKGPRTHLGKNDDIHTNHNEGSDPFAHTSPKITRQQGFCSRFTVPAPAPAPAPVMWLVRNHRYDLCAQQSQPACRSEVRKGAEKQDHRGYKTSNVSNECTSCPCCA